MIRYLCLTLAWLNMHAVAADAPSLSLAEAVQLALHNEPAIEQYLREAEARAAAAIADAQLPDPTLQLTGLNLPVDTFELQQEPVTQLLVGLSQPLPSLKTLRLRRAVGDMESLESAALADAQRLWVKRQTERAWLMRLHNLLDQQRLHAQLALFDQLLDQATARYSSGSLQQFVLFDMDIEREQAATEAQTAKLLARERTAELARWVGNAAERPPPLQWPEWPPAVDTSQPLAAQLARHPQLQALAHRVSAEATRSDLSRQRYKPAWSANLSYGLRAGNNPDGSELPDFLTAGVSLTLPLFPRLRQDQQVRASDLRTEASQQAYDRALRDRISETNSLIQRLRQLDAQLQRYDSHILPAAANHVAAARSAYQTDISALADWLRAQLRQQRLLQQRDALRLQQADTQSALHFLLPPEFPVETH